MKVRSFIFLLVATAALAPSRGFSQQINTAKDPYLAEPSKRETAEAKVPWGVVLDGRYDVYGGHDYGDAPSLAAGADLYYDAWQIGYHNEYYGGLVRFGPRSVGRDWWSGVFAEIGSGKGTLPDSVNTFPYSFWGLGIQYNYSANFKGFQAGFNLSLKVGNASYDAGKYRSHDVSSGSTETIVPYGADNSAYFEIMYSLMYRIPINTMSLTLGADAFAVGKPGINDHPGAWGINAHVAYAFNFEN